ncbi:unnamed protein product [Lactuca virosa]|uniref:Uncharacterized protein n=1 Tax=Lactuca virosa TaxID=75947 RepID=A0AAU9LIK4_9ASTR|nr:unnamed protein product [Lactuca virosa]
MLAGEKSAVEDQVVTLDMEVDRLSQQVQCLEANKGTLEGCLRQQSEHMESEALKRNTLEEDLAWVLQKGVIRVVDRVIESGDFSLGIRRMKSACVVAGMESGKEAVRKQLAIGHFNPSESNDVIQSAHTMRASIKACAQTDFVSYLRLGELDLTSLRQLCCDSNSEGPVLDSGSGGVGPSSLPHGN